MAETSAQEALLAELLGDVHTLREEVSAISQVVPNVRDAIERAGGSAANGMEQLATRIDAMLNERIVQMASAVKDVSAMREMLVGAVALKASEQARAQLLDAVREVHAQPKARRVRDQLNWLYAGLCGAAVSSFATAWIVLRLVSH
ncbi:hypothetical protein V4C85_20275 [Ralstonia solanacearum]|uniref:hypothetical protein n=1 Tax=Ralstonia solanacearum TaxID=305 RepID=UPI0007C93A4D|nr:hypothetical protein [Ralstonia solanacearum]OAI58819.1 hypothetical protein RSP597_24855 [Ralstonia solanacearum]